MEVGEVLEDGAGALASAMAEEGWLVALRLARGCRAFAARREGEVVAYGWLTAGPEWIGELGREIRPGPGEAYVWNCVTLPAHRRQGLFHGLLVRLTAVAQGEGRQRLWIGGMAGSAEGAVAAAGYVAAVHLAEAPGGRFALRQGAASRDLVRAARKALGLEQDLTFTPGPPRRH